MTRDDFPYKIKKVISQRSAYTCSNPDCNNLCIGPSKEKIDQVNYFGKVAHISAASEGGPRYDPSLTPEERSSIENAIFLCSNCADMIDKNNGVDYNNSVLKKWKEDHEREIRKRLKSQKPLKSTIAELDSELESNEIFFQNMLTTEGIGGSLELRLITYFDTPMKRNMTREELRELKNILYGKSFGPPSGLSFDDILRHLQLHRRGLYNFPKIENSPFGCICIFNDGTIIYQYNYFDLHLQGSNNKLSMYTFSVILLGFIDFIFFYYQKIGYKDNLKIIFKAYHLLGWWYSRMPDFMPVDEVARYRSRTDNFDPFEYEFNLNRINQKEQRLEVVQLLLTEFLLDFGFDDEFSIDKRILDKY